MYLCKQSSLFGRVTEWVNVPADPWAGSGAKVLLHKPQPDGHLVNDGIVVGGCLVVHAPSCVDELQLFGGSDQVAHLPIRQGELIVSTKSNVHVGRVHFHIVCCMIIVVMPISQSLHRVSNNV